MLHLGPGYLVALAVAEFLSSRVVPELSGLFYGALLLLLLLHAGLSWDRPFRVLPLSLTLAPTLQISLLFWGGAPAWCRPLALGLSLLLALGVTLYLTVGSSFLGNLPDRRRWKWFLRRTWVGAHHYQRLFQVGWSIRCQKWLSQNGWLGDRRYGWMLPGLALLPAILLPLVALSYADVSGVSSQYVGASAILRIDVVALLGRHIDLKDRDLPLPRIVERILGGGPRPAEYWRVASSVALAARGAVLPCAGPQEQVPARPLWTYRPDRRTLTAEPAPPPWLDDAAEIRALVVVDRRSWAEEGSLTPSPPASPMELLAAAYPDCPIRDFTNLYPRGVCTWYVQERRPDLPGFLGDSGLAMNWARSAERCGFPVDRRPAVGAVLVFPPGANGASSGGHVAYVEAVGATSLRISECNVSYNSPVAEFPHWWEAGYFCAHRSISFDWLDPRVQYIHRQERVRHLLSMKDMLDDEGEIILR